MTGRTTPIEFEERVDRKLRIFKEASKMSMKAIANEAVDAYINAYLDDNAGVRAKFQAEEARFLASAGDNISLIKPRKAKNSTTSKEALK